jgi:hypothetical protein
MDPVISVAKKLPHRRVPFKSELPGSFVSQFLRISLSFTIPTSPYNFPTQLQVNMVNWSDPKEIALDSGRC